MERLLSSSDSSSLGTPSASPVGAPDGGGAAPSALLSIFLASGPAKVASRSMISRSRTLPSFNSSRQIIIAWNVSGLSQRPAIIVSRPASIRLAIAISPSRDKSSTEPISRRYMRTGSSVRSPPVPVFADFTTAVD